MSRKKGKRRPPSVTIRGPCPFCGEHITVTVEKQQVKAMTKSFKMPGPQANSYLKKTIGSVKLRPVNVRRQLVEGRVIQRARKYADRYKDLLSPSSYGVFKSVIRQIMKAMSEEVEEPVQGSTTSIGKTNPVKAKSSK